MGADSLEAASTLYSIATVLTANANFAAAEPLYERLADSPIASEGGRQPRSRHDARPRRPVRADARTGESRGDVAARRVRGGETLRHAEPRVCHLPGGPGQPVSRPGRLLPGGSGPPSQPRHQGSEAWPGAHSGGGRPGGAGAGGRRPGPLCGGGAPAGRGWRSSRSASARSIPASPPRSKNSGRSAWTGETMPMPSLSSIAHWTCASPGSARSAWRWAGRWTTWASSIAVLATTRQPRHA